jgi:uncharacterized Ntn-hydrolase superfamily protein
MPATDPRPSTFSIVAYDPNLPAWGIAVASKFPGVGSVVPWAQAGIGAVATQALANTAFGPAGLALMAEGLRSRQALARLLAGDDLAPERQVGLVDAAGSSASHTGRGCLEWAGSLTHPGLALQGNILSGPQVLQAMLEAYLSSREPFPERLVAALQAGDDAGGDRRGRQSASLLVAKSKAGYGGMNDRWLDCRVDDHRQPIPELSRLLELQRLYFGQSPPNERLSLSSEVVHELQEMMGRLGYYSGAPSGKLDTPTLAALRQFIGNENFEERIDFGAGWIDRPALEYLRHRYAG